MLRTGSFQFIALVSLCVGIVLLVGNLRGRLLRSRWEVVVTILTTIAGLLLTLVGLLAVLIASAVQ